MKWSTPPSVSSSTSSRTSGPGWRESTGSSLPKVRLGRGEAREAGEQDLVVLVVLVVLEVTATTDVVVVVVVAGAVEDSTEEDTTVGSTTEGEEVSIITEEVLRMFVTAPPSRDTAVTTT